MISSVLIGLMRTNIVSSGYNFPQLKVIGPISYCVLCRAPYVRFGNLLNHISEKHNDIDISEHLTCDTCGKVFENYKKLNRHVKAVH